MTTRTVQVYGQVTKDNLPVTGTLTATLNGNTVFSGTVPLSVGNPAVLFQFDVDMALEGSIPMTMTWENMDIAMSSILANYCNGGAVVPATNPPTFISTGPSGWLDTSPGNDSRANVTATGVSYCSPPPPDPRPEGASGTWGWQVDSAEGQTANFSYNLVIVAGVE